MQPFYPRRPLRRLLDIVPYLVQCFPSTVKGHGVSTIGNQYRPFCLNNRIADRGRRLWNGAIHPSQRQSG